MTDTPVAMIVFRRPDLAKEVLKSVRSAGIRKLYVIGDGPREHVPEDLASVQETRDLFENLDWDCEVTRIYSDVNLGLRTRVLTGLDEVFRTESRAIILEDDCVPHIDFF